jgi:hypothetical protein
VEETVVVEDWEAVKVGDRVAVTDADGEEGPEKEGLPDTEGEEVKVEERVGVTVPTGLWDVVRVVKEEKDTPSDWVKDGVTEVEGVKGPDPLPTQLLLCWELPLGEGRVLPVRKAEGVDEEERQRLGDGEGESKPLEVPPPAAPAGEALKEGEGQGEGVSVAGEEEEGLSVPLPSIPDVGVAAAPPEPLESGV